MKSNLFASLLVSSMLLVSSLAAAEPRQRAYTNEVNGVELKMRPSLHSPTIATLPHDTFVMMWGGESDVQQVNGAQGRWVYVQSPKGRGWLFSAYLQADSPVKSKATDMVKRKTNNQQPNNHDTLARLE